MKRGAAPFSIVVLIALALAACSKSSSSVKTSSIADAGAAQIDPTSRALILDKPDHGGSDRHTGVRGGVRAGTSVVLLLQAAE